MRKGLHYTNLPAHSVLGKRCGREVASGRWWRKEGVRREEVGSGRGYGGGGGGREVLGGKVL